MAASSDPEVIIQAHTHQFVRGEVKRVTLRLSVMKAAKATRLTHWMGRMGTGRCCLEEWAGNFSLLSYTFSSMTSFWRQTSCSHFSKPIQVVCSGCKRMLHVRKLRHGRPSLQLVWCIWSQSRNPALHQPHLAWQGNLSIQILLRRRWVLLCQGFDHIAISIKMEKIALHAFFSLILNQLFISSV